MTKEEPDFLSESEARDVWERAVRLQLEASPVGEEVQGQGLALFPPEGHEVIHVREAAEEVGIERRFLDAALDEVKAERFLPAPPTNRVWAARFFGGLLDTVAVSRIIKASPQRTLSVLLEQSSSGSSGLRLSDRIGDPLASGVLVFDIKGLGLLQKPWLAKEVSASAVRQVYVSIRELEGALPSCEVTLRGPIAWSHNTGLVHGLLVSTLTGGLGGTAVGVAAAAVLGGLLVTPLGVAVTGISAGVGLVSGGGLGRKGYRAFCRYGIERAGRALEKVLVGVTVKAEQDLDEAKEKLGSE